MKNATEFTQKVGSSQIIKKTPTQKEIKKHLIFFLRGRGMKKTEKLTSDELVNPYEKFKKFDDDFVPIGSKEEEDLIKGQKKRKASDKEYKVSKKKKVEYTDDEIRNYIRIMDFSDEIQKDEKEYESELSSFYATEDALVIERANGHRREFTTLRSILNVLTRDDLMKLFKLMEGYYLHIPPTGLGKQFEHDMLDLMQAQGCNADMWNDQENWMIQRWRIFMDSGVHVLELQDGRIIHMLGDLRYPLTVDTLNTMMMNGLHVLNKEELDEYIRCFTLFIKVWIAALEG